MAKIMPILLLVGAVILQTTIVTRINMLHGAADLVLLVLLGWVLQADEKSHWHWGVLAGLLVGVSSALPFWLPVVGYTMVIAIVVFFQRQLWQVPVWSLLIITFIGTFAVYGIEVIFLWIIGVPITLGEVFNIVLLPSVIMNILIVIPIHALVGEVVKLVYPREVEV